MPLRSFIAAWLIAAVAAPVAQARTVYKCTTPQGAVAYQDEACARGQRESVLQIDAPAPAEPASTESITAANAADTRPLTSPVKPSAPPTPPRARKALLPLWICTRPEDRSSYFSRDGVTQSRLVPLAMLGYPPKSLGEVYGPGGGVSAPESSKPPTAPASGRNSIGDAYTEVRDDCQPASPDQTCSYLRSELDSVDKQLRNAFKDNRAVLEPRQRELRDDLDACD